MKRTRIERDAYMAALSADAKEAFNKRKLRTEERKIKVARAIHEEAERRWVIMQKRYGSLSQDLTQGEE